MFLFILSGQELEPHRKLITQYRDSLKQLLADTRELNRLNWLWKIREYENTLIQVKSKFEEWEDILSHQNGLYRLKIKQSLENDLKEIESLYKQLDDALNEKGWLKKKFTIFGIEEVIKGKAYELGKSQELQDRNFRLESIKAYAALAVFFTLIINLNETKQQLANTQKQLSLVREKMLTDRFSKAIDHLGSDKKNANTGGIYALEKIAETDRDTYHWTTMEVLTAYVRQKHQLPLEYIRKRDPKPKDVHPKSLEKWRNLKKYIDEEINKDKDNEGSKLPRMTIDVRAALAVIGRQSHKDKDKDPPEKNLDLTNTNLRGVIFGRQSHKDKDKDPPEKNLDLTNTNLRGVIFGKTDSLEKADFGGSYLGENITTFEGANLRGANFGNAYLAGANLTGADLEGADFCGPYIDGAFLEKAILIGAKLNRANLCGAILIKANLSDANLSDANLSDANLSDANLSDANLSDADLSGANLEKANFEGVKGLTLTQIKSACFWDKAVYDRSFKQKLGRDKPNPNDPNCDKWNKTKP